MRNYLGGFLILCLLMTGCGGNKPASEASEENLTPKDTFEINVQEESTESETESEEIEAESAVTEMETAEQQSAGEKALLDLQQQIVEKGDLGAVAYLGYFEGTYQELPGYFETNNFLETFAFLGEISEERFIEMEGCELYAVIPASADTQIEVREFVLDDMEDYMPEPEKELGSFQDGQVLLLKGNVSEIVPNLYLTMTKGDLAVEYTPSLTLMDGTLTKSEGIYDISPYELLGIEPEVVTESEGQELN